MNEWLLALCRQLENSSGSISLHESLYLYSLIETTHVLAICLFVGTLFMVDFRLIGWSFTTIPLSEVSKKILPFTIIGFLIMIVTGALLFYAIPVRTYQSIFFRIKITLLLVAGVNAFLLHLKMSASEPDINVSRTIKVAAATSLITWGSVIIMGRMIAYNWFDCDKSGLSESLYWLAGCDDSS